MPSFYTIVRFVPDPVTEECINIGVIAFSDTDECESVFLRNWTRAKRFSGSDVDFLRDFARDIAAHSGSQLSLTIGGDSGPLTAEQLREHSKHWINCIQLSEPRASLLPVNELAPRMAMRFLHTPERKRRGFRDRRVAVSLGRSAVEQALGSAPHNEKVILEAKPGPMAGSLDSHVFDFALLGSSSAIPLIAVKGMSFEGRHTNELQREIDATAWAVDDIYKASPDLSIAILTLPPRTTGKRYETAKRIYEGLGARVVEESEATDWARSSVTDALSRA
jgi:hypothetical protein